MRPQNGNRTRLVVLVGVWMLLCGLAARAQAAQMVGGPCAYVDYPGQATIVAVVPRSQDGGPGPRLDVTFTFTPDAPIRDQPLHEPGRAHHLTLTGGQAPGPRFMEKYGLKPGQALPCRLRAIRQGTCTPVLFDFPGIDLTDDPDRN